MNNHPGVRVNKSKKSGHPIKNIIAACEMCGLSVFHEQDHTLADMFPSQFPEGFTFVPVAHHAPCGRMCVAGPLPANIKYVHRRTLCEACGVDTDVAV